MTRRVRSVLVAEVGGALGLLTLAAFTLSAPHPSAWAECCLLSIAAAVSTLFYSRAPVGGATCSPVTVFAVGAAVLLPPALVALFLVLPIAVAHIARRQPWWVQLNNLANYLTALLSGAFLGRAVSHSFAGPAAHALGALVAAIVLVGTNLGLLALFRSRHLGTAIRAASLDRESTEGELLSAALGVTCAAVLGSAPWMTPFVLVSVIALPRAFSLPLIRRDAVDRAHELERERIANERLREVDRLKREFVAVVSHELAAPIASIGGYTELVLKGSDPLTDEQRYFVAVVERNSQRLNRLVADLALMDEVENELDMTFDAVNMCSIAGDSVAAAQPNAAAKQIELNFIAGGDCTVFGDAGRLGQVVDNLISNAIKYTPSGGGVEVHLRSNGDNVELSVTDNGPGIAPHEQQRLFERFFRTASAKQSSTSGSGLGLSIVKTIVDKHDGTVSVVSSEGGGATFRVALPVRAESPGSSARRGAPLPAL